jgi:hypothetical protein
VSTRTHKARPAARRDRFREALAAASAQDRLNLAYDWFRSELAKLDKADPARAATLRRHVTDALLANAETLAREAAERDKAACVRNPLRRMVNT